eukprot:s1196_g6.t1
MAVALRMFVCLVLREPRSLRVLRYNANPARPGSIKMMAEAQAANAVAKANIKIRRDKVNARYVLSPRQHWA